MTLLDILPSLRPVNRPRLDPAIWPLTAHTDDLGRLCVGGIALTDVADEFGTPTCVIDEDDFRQRARRCRKSAGALYCGRTLLTVAVARWARDENVGVTVGSAAELATALAGGIDPGRIVWNSAGHDNLCDAVAAGVGRIVVETPVDIGYLAGLLRGPQSVLLRVTPDVDPAESIRLVLAAPHLQFVGVHADSVRHAIAVLADIRARQGIIITEVTACGDNAGAVDDALDEACAAERFPRPRLVLERSPAISAQAGVTLYRVTRVTSSALTLDGDIAGDATVTLANRHSLGPSRLTTVGGHEIELPIDVHPGDLLAVARTGDHRPGLAAPLVALKDRHVHELIRRETVAASSAANRPTRPAGAGRPRDASARSTSG